MLRLTQPRKRLRGFTLIEMVVVMAMLGLLLSIAVPTYMASYEQGRERVLAHNLAQLREAIDRYYGDRGVYPDRLQDLVDRRYLRAVPLNPYTETADWQAVAPPPGQGGRIYDVVAGTTAPPPNGTPAGTANETRDP